MPRYIDPDRCSEVVYTPGAFSGHQCSNKVKVTVNGEGYCGTHNPEAVAARRAKANEKWQRSWAETQRGWALKAQERIVLIAAADWRKFIHTYDVCPEACDHPVCALARAVDDYLKI